jgi:hypothetical protein
MILARCVTARSEADAYADALGLDALVVVRMHSDIRLAQERMRRRETASEGETEWHVARVAEHFAEHEAGVADPHVINDANADLREVAAGLARQVRWLPTAAR